MGRDEVLEDGEALTVVRANRAFNQLLLRVGHQATHTRDLLNLRPVTTGPRLNHPVHRVLRGEVLPHVVCNHLGAFGPHVNQFAVAIFSADQTTIVLTLNLRCLLLILRENLHLVR